MLVAFTLASCTNSLQDKQQVGCYPEDSEFTVICDNVRGYTYKQPSWIRGANLKEREVSVSTYDYPLTEEEKERLKDTYYRVIPSPTSCTPEIMGYPQDPVEIEEGGYRTIWGKVFDDRGMGNTPSMDALCDYPQATRECESIGENCNDGAGAYAFCSENLGDPADEEDDKRVTICISQQIDDPRTAADIFSTFRWTDVPESSMQENLNDFELWGDEMVKQKRTFLDKALSPFSLAFPDDSRVQQYGDPASKEITIYHPEPPFSFFAYILEAKGDESLENFVQDYRTNATTWNEGGGTLTIAEPDNSFRNGWIGTQPNTVELNLPMRNWPYDDYEYHPMEDTTFSIEPDTMLLFTKKDSKVLILAIPFSRKDDVIPLLQ